MKVKQAGLLFATLFGIVISASPVKAGGFNDNFGNDGGFQSNPSNLSGVNTTNNDFGINANPNAQTSVTNNSAANSSTTVVNPGSNTNFTILPGGTRCPHDVLNYGATANLGFAGGDGFNSSYTGALGAYIAKTDIQNDDLEKVCKIIGDMKSLEARLNVQFNSIEWCDKVGVPIAAKYQLRTLPDAWSDLKVCDPLIARYWELKTQETVQPITQQPGETPEKKEPETPVVNSSY